MSAGRIALALVLASCAGRATAPGRLDYEGHRGARGLRPENTLVAFEHALALGVDTLEMDIVLTADDVLVVHHDLRLAPAITRDATGAWLAAEGPTVHSVALDELRRFDVGRIQPGTAYAARFPDQVGSDGVRIPTLAEVVALAEARSQHRVRYNIEIKTEPEHPDDTPPPEVVADRLVAFVQQAGIAARATIQSFDWRSLRRVAEIAPSLRRSCLTKDDISPRRAHAAAGPGWSPDNATHSPAAIAEAHQLGLAVIPWTVNDPSAIARLITWGVDGIITDYPDRLPRR